MSKVKIVVTVTETETKKIIYDLNEDELMTAVKNGDENAKEALQALKELRKVGESSNETDLYLYCRDCCKEDYSSSKYYEYDVNEVELVEV